MLGELFTGVEIIACIVPFAVLSKFNDFNPERAMKGNDALKLGIGVNWSFQVLPASLSSILC